jgi:hypothetical protein
VKERLKSIKRILAVQEQLRGLAETRLAALARRGDALEATRRDLVGALNEDQALHGLFVASMARRVSQVSREIAEVEKAKDVQARLLLQHSGRLKQVERVAGSLDRRYREARERKELAEMLDAMRPPTARLP